MAKRTIVVSFPTLMRSPYIATYALFSTKDKHKKEDYVAL